MSFFFKIFLKILQFYCNMSRPLFFPSFLPSFLSSFLPLLFSLAWHMIRQFNLRYIFWFISRKLIYILFLLQSHSFYSYLRGLPLEGSETSLFIFSVSNFSLFFPSILSLCAALWKIFSVFWSKYNFSFYMCHSPMYSLLKSYFFFFN